MSTTVDIKFPISISVNDYHEFDDIAHLLSELTGQCVMYEEIEVDLFGSWEADVERNISSTAPYVAVFYIERDEDFQVLRESFETLED